MTAEEIRKKIQLFVDAGADRSKVEAANDGACIMAASEIAAQLAEMNETLRSVVIAANGRPTPMIPSELKKIPYSSVVGAGIMEQNGQLVIVVPPRGKNESERIRDICFDALVAELEKTK